VTPSGTLLAAYDGRPNLDDLPSPIDLLLRRSTDGGATWGPQQVVRTGTGLEGFGDPSLLMDQQTGRVFLFHAAATRAGFFESGLGVEPSDDVQHVDLGWSDDDGLTWQFRRLTRELKLGPDGTDRGVTGLFAAAGNGIQVHTGRFRGRLVQQLVLLVDGEIRAASALSDDHGETWRVGEFVPPGPNSLSPNENKVACLSDGRLLLHSRGTPHRLEAWSEDGGLTWSPLRPVTELPDPSDNGSLARFDGLPMVTGLAEPATSSWLVASHNHDPHLRRNTVLRLSRDDGRTWPHTLVLCPGSSAYSTAVRLPGGDFGVLYERNGYHEVVFASVPAEALMAAGPLPEDLRTPLAFDLVLRSVTPARPSAWQHVGESHVVPLVAAGVADHAWKEVGLGYAADEGQVLGTRQAQDANYGPVRPGYQPGDILAFSGRVRNTGAQPLADVTLHGPHDNAGDFAPTHLAPGEAAAFHSPTVRVADADLRHRTATLRFVVSAWDSGAGTPVQAVAEFEVDLETGVVTPR
jgi:sialidase-1